MIPLKQSTASQEIPLGIFVDSTDGNTAETALTIANTDVRVWKAGATTLASKNSGGATHISNGIYYAVLDATDTDTLGPLVIFVHVAGALSVRLECCVYPANVYDSLFAGTASLTVGDSSGVTTLLSRVSSARAGYLDNLNGHVAQTGDSYARLGAPAGASVSADIASRLPTSSYTAPPSAADNADAVWDEVLSGHLTAGSTGNALNAAGSAGDPWSTTLPGAYGAGSAGNIIGNNLNATVSSRSFHAAADVWAVGTRTLTGFGTLVSDIWSNATRTLSAFGFSVTASSVTDKTGYSLTTTPPTANENADALLDRAAGVETGWTIRQAMRIMLATLAGRVNGAGTSTVNIRDMADSKNRITATVDADGNRTAVTRDAS